MAAALAANPSTDVLVFPEVHLFGGAEKSGDEDAWYRSLAEPIPGERTHLLAAIAREHGVWLLPGSLPELDEGGALFNTAVVFSPQGDLADIYRKVFPWRPAEPWTSGSSFSAFDAPGLGRLGVNICYDSWYPESTRQIAWFGAEAVFNIVKTTTPDRAQELILARANAITNQVFYLSLNAAGPVGMGRSVFVDPQGGVIYESPDAQEETIPIEIDLDEVTNTRETGTAGTNRMWSQFRVEDGPIALPAYGGSIEPLRWCEREQNGHRA
ncbi:MAG: carbon-nitrogen hydrolase family protein [Kocuria sp.]|nr:carbon-nitrogen hydrolase family protein [Kocuria sp.]